MKKKRQLQKYDNVYLCDKYFICKQIENKYKFYFCLKEKGICNKEESINWKRYYNSEQISLYNYKRFYDK